MKCVEIFRDIFLDQFFIVYGGVFTDGAVVVELVMRNLFALLLLP